MAENSEIDFETISSGDALPEARIVMEPDTYFAYNRLVNEINPLHFDKQYAQSLGYKDIVVAGVYTFSFIPQMVETWVGGADNIRTVNVRFHNPVYIGETIILNARVTGKRRMEDGNMVDVEVTANDSAGALLISATVAADMGI